MSEKMTPIRAAAEAMEDAAFRLTGRDLGTLYRDRIATEAITAALDAVDLPAIIDHAMDDHGDSDVAAEWIRAALLEGSDR